MCCKTPDPCYIINIPLSDVTILYKIIQPLQYFLQQPQQEQQEQEGIEQEQEQQPAPSPICCSAIKPIISIKTSFTLSPVFAEAS